MVTNSAGPDKGQRCSFRKTSKPLMEKKRRARINVSLEQLKSLLEKHYSQNIRKRKLEKADILELTVKYLKNIQSAAHGVPLLKTAEYQTGFRNCLYGVSQFLMRSEEGSESLCLRLLRDLGRALPASSAGFRTTDSASPGAGTIFRTADSGLPIPFASFKATESGFSQWTHPPTSSLGLEQGAVATDLSNGPQSEQGTPSHRHLRGASDQAESQELKKHPAANTQPLLLSANAEPTSPRTVHPTESVWRPW
ncbi:transcription factor HES-3 [Ambystoma mexicanum]|uniref:transcription factor HES-3 n=1 Tax=Ambystoma mexicanum TaxID=8296 RepID=UPI0037E9257F